MDIENLSGATAMVTGAASGIGKESALAFARQGADLAICDLDAEGLAATEQAVRALGRDVVADRVDVASAEAMRAFAEKVHGQVDAVDILMNNAGVGLGAGFLDTTLEDWDWILGINLKGVIHGCHFFLPRMVERGRGGHVVNVASAAGFFASAPLSAYSTTKFGVVGLSESLRDELAPHGIGVTAVCPGLIDTPITRRSPLRGVPDPEAARAQMVELYRRRGYTPARVARNVLKAVQRGRAVAPISPEAWALYYLKRWAPWLAFRLTRRISESSRRRFEAAPKETP
jgi:NAD(P)-dependent dehydrogenase (short-subunit alcohol dehydrogenase family)